MARFTRVKRCINIPHNLSEIRQMPKRFPLYKVALQTISFYEQALLCTPQHSFHNMLFGSSPSEFTKIMVPNCLSEEPEDYLKDQHLTKTFIMFHCYLPLGKGTITIIMDYLHHYDGKQNQ